jgi:hypothetical protein
MATELCKSSKKKSGSFHFHKAHKAQQP